MLELSAASPAVELRISELDEWVCQDGGQRSCLGAFPSPPLGFQGVLGGNPEPECRG